MDIAIFTRQLATMMKAGVPLVQSFEIVAEGLDNASMREVVLGIKAEVEGGSNFATALRKYPLLFDDLFAAWSVLANSRVLWKPCSTAWPNTRKRANCSSKRSRRR